MRIVLTGVTGFAGGVTLARLLSTDSVDAVTVLSRKPAGRMPPGRKQLTWKPRLWAARARRSRSVWP